MYKEFKSEGATVRVHGAVNQEAVRKATEKFMKGVENEKRKIKSKAS